jgi:hypothetical protein
MARTGTMALGFLLPWGPQRRCSLGLLDRVWKRGAEAPAADVSASAVKRKYQAVLQLIEREHVRVLNLHVEGGRLYLKGAAPTDEARGRILAAIRAITPEDDADIVADISVG